MTAVADASTAPSAEARGEQREDHRRRDDPARAVSRSSIFVRVHTDEGLIGVSDTFYTADAVRGFVHETAASILLGKDPRDIERHWDALYARTVARWGGVGHEMRAISAIDAALWDILGQSLGTPIYQLLGGLAHDRIRDLQHVRRARCTGRAAFSRAGEGKGPLEDLWAQINEPEVLAAGAPVGGHHAR